MGLRAIRRRMRKAAPPPVRDGDRIEDVTAKFGFGTPVYSVGMVWLLPDGRLMAIPKIRKGVVSGVTFHKGPS